MSLKRSAVGAVFALCLGVPAAAEMYTIKNPAEKINNPADKIYNPATQVKNPAANIYNPATRMNSPDPLSPPTQPVIQQAAPETPSARPETLSNKKPQPKPAVPHKKYDFKTVSAYINAAKRAFSRDDYREFIAITEDALRRIDAGTLKASRKSKQRLSGYKIFGYGLLEKNED
ncbi:MAG: hypothetical protein IPQ16_09495 [Geobacteraceae bacterium]|nr:hypothetical protein [Geobacteraceae bacterium]